MNGPHGVSFTFDRVTWPLYWKAMAAAAAPDSDANRRSGAFVIQTVIWFLVVLVLVYLLQIEVDLTAGLIFIAGMAFLWVVLYGCNWVTRKRLRRQFEREQDRRGPTEATLRADGIKFASSFGVSDITWRAVDGVLDLGNGTGLKVGLVVYPIPDEGLPAGLNPQAFRDRLDAWRTAP